MGSEQSTSSQRNNRATYGEDDVRRMLEEQERRIRERYSQQSAQDRHQAAMLAREAARKEVERLVLQEKNKINITPTVDTTPSPSSTSLERDRTPYSFTQNDIHIGVAQQTKTCLYPNLQASGSSSSPSHPTAPAAFHNYNRANAQTTSPMPTAPPTYLPTPMTPSTPMPSAPPAPISPARAVPGPAQRDRSASRRPIKNRVEDDELNCPTCRQKYTINIYQCEAGHSSCSNCKGRLCCGICGRAIGDVRNRSLEEYIAERKIKCPNSKDGCSLYIKMAELEAHEKECPYQEMKCPLADIFGQCQWRGRLPQISKHFDEVHPIHRTGNVNEELLVTRSEKQIVYFVMLGTFNFLFHLKVSESDRKVYMTVQLIGTKHSAEKWSYEVHVYNKSQPRKKYQYSDICHSTSTPLTEIFGIEKCAVLPFAYVDTFVNRDILNYKFFIKRDVESKSARNYDGARRRYERN